MNKVKMIFWLVILGFISLLIFQNQEFFLAKQGLRVNLFFETFHTPDLPSAIFFLAFFLLGLLIAYFLGLYAKFKSRQMIKSLNLKVNSQAETISRIEAENESLKTALTEKNQEKTGEISEQPGDEPGPFEAAQND